MHMLSLLENKRVLVTGSTGFLGSALCTWMNDRGVKTFGVSSKDCDLRDANQTIEQFSRIKPDIVFHCAVQGGGIGWMKENPVASGVDNLLQTTKQPSGPVTKATPIPAINALTKKSSNILIFLYPLFRVNMVMFMLIYR